MAIADNMTRQKYQDDSIANDNNTSRPEPRPHDTGREDTIMHTHTHAKTVPSVIIDLAAAKTPDDKESASVPLLVCSLRLSIICVDHKSRKGENSNK